MNYDIKIRVNLLITKYLTPYFQPFITLFARFYWGRQVYNCLFLLVYGLSIPLWIIETTIDVDRLPLNFSITDILAAFTPLIAASILVHKEEGRAGIATLFRRIFDAVVEETGYMGYAIDPMQERFGALPASILMGISWAVWHYPSILQQGHDWTWIAWGTLGTVAVRVLIVWLYNNTQKSLFACILFHTLLNVGRPLFPADQTHNPLVDYPVIHYSVLAIIAVLVVFLWGSKTMTRYKFT